MWRCEKCGREFKNLNQDHYCGEIKTVDEYIADQPEAVRPLLQKVREAIHAGAPEAVEKIAWDLPAFWQGEYIVCFAASKKHIGIYMRGADISVFDERLEGYKKSKGTVQLPLNKPIDSDLITDIAKWRVANAEGNGKK
jgi:uncharacterized protein YdhG (YjbR/CyaY superfamily)